MKALVTMALAATVACTAQQQAAVKAAAGDVETAVNAACALVASASLLTDKVKEAQELCKHREAPPWRILEAVAACEIEAK